MIDEFDLNRLTTDEIEHLNEHVTNVPDMLNMFAGHAIIRSLTGNEPCQECKVIANKLDIKV